MELNAVIARGATIMQYKICHGISSHRKILLTASSLSSPSFSPGSYATAVKVTIKDTERQCMYRASIFAFEDAYVSGWGKWAAV